MALAETLGYLASGLVLLTFGMRTMMAMRMVAIGSNLAFIAYGLSLDLPPIWVLHVALLPLNTYRLYELQRGMRRRQEAAGGDLPFDLRRQRRSSRRVSPSARTDLLLDSARHRPRKWRDEPHAGYAHPDS